MTTELQAMFGAEIDELQEYRSRHPLHAPYWHSTETSREEAVREFVRKKHQYIARKQETS